MTPASQQIAAPRFRRASRPSLAILALLWTGFLALAILAAATGATQAGPGEPPLVILAFVLLPPLLFLIAHARSARLRAWVASLDLTAVTMAQSWRVGGILFLPLAWWGHLSWAFALPAGLGDAAVGLLAPFVAIAVERRAAGWRRASYGLVILGLVDFVVAIAMGAAVSGAVPSLAAPAAEPILGALPLSLIPTVLVPTWIVLHLIAWLRVRSA